MFKNMIVYYRNIGQKIKPWIHDQSLKNIVKQLKIVAYFRRKFKPYSLFPIPYSLFPIPYYPLPITHYPLPITY
jgi:hypothetical protein